MKIHLIVDDILVGYAEFSKQTNINPYLYCIPDTCKKRLLYLQLLRIRPEYRLKGHGTSLIKLVKQYADDNNVVICLDAEPLDRTTPHAVLYKIYKDNGFIYCRDNSYTYGITYE